MEVDEGSGTLFITLVLKGGKTLAQFPQADYNDGGLFLFPSTDIPNVTSEMVRTNGYLWFRRNDAGSDISLSCNAQFEVSDDDSRYETHVISFKADKNQNYAGFDYLLRERRHAPPP